jgi:hypothetical protein
MTDIDGGGKKGRMDVEGRSYMYIWAGQVAGLRCFCSSHHFPHSHTHTPFCIQHFRFLYLFTFYHIIHP